MIPNSALRLAGCLVVSLILNSCDGDSKPYYEAVEVRQFNLQGISVVEPENSTDQIFLNINQGIQLGVEGSNHLGTVVPLSASDRSWTTSDASVATINENGYLVARSNGPVSVSVSLGGLTSNAYALTVADATLSQVEAIFNSENADNVSLDRCRPETFYATGRFSDDTVRNISNVTWSLSDTTNAQLLDSTGSSTRVNGLNPSDNVSLIASVDGALSGQLDLIITDSLQSIAIGPGVPPFDVDNGSNRQLVANGIYNETINGQVQTGVPQLITENVNWLIDFGRSNINLSNVSGTRGLLTGSSAGDAGISVRCGNETEPAVARVRVIDAGTNDTSSGLAIRIAGLDVVDNEITLSPPALPVTYRMFISTGTVYDAENDVV